MSWYNINLYLYYNIQSITDKNIYIICLVINMSKIIESTDSDFDDASSAFIKSTTEEFNILTVIHIIIIAIAIIHVIYLILMLIKINCFSDKEISIDDHGKRLKKINDTCTICLDEIQNEVQLLCSHSFCAKCIISYAKQRFSFVDVKCPYCRVNSKLMIAKFEKNETNEEDFEEIINYNHQLTSRMKTSLCFCVDTFRFFMFYTKQILDFNNPAYANERCCFFVLMILIGFILVYPFLGGVSQWLVLIQDFCLYCGLVSIFAEMFYSRIRRATNRQFDLVRIENERRSRNNTGNLENNNNNEQNIQNNNVERQAENIENSSNINNPNSHNHQENNESNLNVE
jgi:hypothetical protein